jgi:hypothetical protein
MNMLIFALGKTTVSIYPTIYHCIESITRFFTVFNSKETLFTICFKNLKGLSSQFAYVTSLTEQGLAN